jgi:hypothetical protein
MSLIKLYERFMARYAILDSYEDIYENFCLLLYDTVQKQLYSIFLPSIKNIHVYRFV